MDNRTLQKPTIKTVLTHPLLNLSITFIIIISLVFLLITKIGSFSMHTRKIFTIIDEIFLAIFAFEFIIKTIFLRKEYIIEKLGWIDLIAALPVLAPLITRILLAYNINFFLSSDDRMNITILFRGFILIRFLRVLRATRLLKLFSEFSTSNINKNMFKFSLVLPITISIVLFISGYFFSSLLQTQLRSQRHTNMQKIATLLSKENANLFLESNSEILKIGVKGKYIHKKNDREIKAQYSAKEIFSISTENTYILYSTRDISLIGNKIEAIIMVVIIIFIISVFLQYNLDIEGIKRAHPELHTKE